METLERHVDNDLLFVSYALKQSFYDIRDILRNFRQKSRNIMHR